MSTPSLTRVEPSTVDTRELPRDVELFGTRLNRSAKLSLIDDAPAHLSPPTVLLDDQPLDVVEQPSAEKLVIKLPPTLAPGSHDLSVKVGGMELRLESGLRITSGSSQLIDASPATDANIDADVTTASPNDARAGTFVTADAFASNVATETNNTTGTDAANPADASTTLPDSKPGRPEPDANESAPDQSDARADATPATTPPRDAGVFADAQVNSTSGDSTQSSNPPSVDASLLFDAGNTKDSGPDGSAVTDAAVGADDPVFRCAPGEFATPEVVTVQGYAEERLWSPALSADGLTLYFTDGSHGSGKLMKATRSDRGNSFVDAEYMPALFATGAIGTPYVTPNGLSLYFYSIQDSGLGSRDMYVATRSSLSADFANPTNLTALNSTSLEHLPWVSRDELWFVWVSQRDGQADCWTATRPSKTDPFSTPQKLPGLTTPENNGRTFISSDGLLAYLVIGDRPGGKGSDDIWYSTRNRLTEDFTPPRNVSSVNTADSETDVTLSHDGEELFFVRTGDTNVLYRAVASCN